MPLAQTNRVNEVSTQQPDELADAWQAYHAGDLDAGEAACQKLLNANAEHVGALFLAALIDYQRGRIEQVVEGLRRVLRLRPNFAEARNNLGNALARQGRLQEAEAEFRLALRAKNDYPEALNNLGNALRDQGKLEEAASAYRRAIELRPDYADCHNNLGIALARLRRDEEAVRCYRRAAELKPGYADPHNNLGIVLATRGRRDEAMAEFRRALDLKPNYADAFFGRVTGVGGAGQRGRESQRQNVFSTPDPFIPRGKLYESHSKPRSNTESPV